MFGTDGVRGIANKGLTCERAMNIGRASYLPFLPTDAVTDPHSYSATTQASSDMLRAAIKAGLCSVGADVIDIGVAAAPRLLLVGKYKADAGIMISASHNPAEFNGIKIFSGNGFKLPDLLEDRIEAIVLDHEGEICLPVGGEIGRVSYETDASRDYTRHIKASVHYSLDGLNIAVDCANGSASATAKKLFDELGANAHILFDKPDGVNINKDCGSTHLEKLSQYVLQNKLDCGIAFDGDADRCLCVDELGNEIDGDMIMAICALDLKERGKLNQNTVVGTIMSNFGFTKFCEEHGIKFVPTKVGDRYVLEEMLLEDYSFGGEQSGHIIFRDIATTGDGQLTATQLLSHMKCSGKKLSELASVMTRYPQTTINLTVSNDGKLAFYTDKIVSDKIAEAKEKLGKTGRIVVRPSGTEPLIRVMVEGMDKDLIKAVAGDVAKTINERVGKK